MTIKISQLGNVAAVQGNVLIPIVSNITGTPTTVKANVDQIQTYILGNAGNIVPAASNVYSIGNATTWWKDLWLSANTLYIGGVPIGSSDGSLTFGGNVVGTSDLPTYTGNVSAGNVAVGASTVYGNITTLPTTSIDGATGNIVASNISTTGDLTTGGDLSAYGDITTTGGVTAGDMTFALKPAGAITLLGGPSLAGTLYTPGRIYETTGGNGTGLTVLVNNVEYGPGAARSLGSPSYGAVKIVNAGSGYQIGDTIYLTHFDDESGGITGSFLVQTVTAAPVSSGTITANTSVWSFDESGDTTVPGDILLPDNTAIYNVDANTAVFTTNSISDATSIYLTDAGNAAVYASEYIILETNSDGNVASQWAFNTNGNIIFPDNTTQQTAFSNTAPVIATLLSNSATQSDLIIGINANVTAANVGMKGYVDSQSFYSNTKVSTYLPTYNGNIGGIAVTSPLVVFGNITAGFAFPTATFANVIFTGGGFANGYAQLNIQNVDSVGTQNSADFIATAPNGTDTSHYIDMGINGNNYSSSAWTISGKNDGYVYINSGNLTLGTDTPNTTVKVHVGGTLAGNVVTTFNSSNVTIGGNLIVSNVYVPTANNSAGTAGQISYDSSYVYVCIAANTWRRANLAIW